MNCDANCDPQFLNPLNSDFRMASGSPAIKTASDGTDRGLLMFSITPLSWSFASTGGSASVTTTASGRWTASAAGYPWISLTTTGPLIGNASVGYTVAPSASSASRTGTILVAGIPHRVTQSGIACNPSLSALSQSIAALGGSSSVTLRQSAGDCAWSATSAASWIAVTNTPSSGTSDEVAITFTVATNASSNSRTGDINIAGRTFRVDQAGLSCGYELTPSSFTLPPNSVVGLTVDLTAAVSDCAWTAASNTAWLTITAGSSGLGSGRVTYRTDANPLNATRSGSLTIGGQTFGVVQQGVPCSQTLSATSGYVGPSGGLGSPVNVTSSAADCTWTTFASPSDPWITVTSAANQTGSGPVTWSAADNPNSTLRTGAISIAGQAVHRQPGGQELHLLAVGHRARLSAVWRAPDQSASRRARTTVRGMRPATPRGSP